MYCNISEDLLNDFCQYNMRRLIMCKYFEKKILVLGGALVLLSSTSVWAMDLNPNPNNINNNNGSSPTVKANFPQHPGAAPQLNWSEQVPAKGLPAGAIMGINDKAEPSGVLGKVDFRYHDQESWSVPTKQKFEVLCQAINKAQTIKVKNPDGSWIDVAHASPRPPKFIPTEVLNKLYHGARVPELGFYNIGVDQDGELYVTISRALFFNGLYVRDKENNDLMLKKVLEGQNLKAELQNPDEENMMYSLKRGAFYEVISDAGMTPELGFMIATAKVSTSQNPDLIEDIDAFMTSLKADRQAFDKQSSQGELPQDQKSNQQK